MEPDNQEEFTEKQIRTAQLAKAFADPANIAILEFMIYQQQCICGSIAKEIPLQETTIQNHLKELKEIGLIKGDTEGDKICYCIRYKVFTEAQTLLNSLFYLYKQNDDCCPEKR